jgi:hypothetical protein
MLGSALSTPNLVRSAILLAGLSIALLAGGCGDSTPAGGAAGAGGGAAAGAGGSLGRGGVGGAAAIGGQAGINDDGGASGNRGLAGADGNSDAAAGNGGDARGGAGGSVVDGEAACQSVNPDPCACGRPDANQLSAAECIEEQTCRAAGGIWEPYVVQLSEGGQYGPRCQTADGAVFDASSLDAPSLDASSLDALSRDGSRDR